jgi:hypothetical protein
MFGRGIGMKASVDGIYPAVQFHLRTDGGTLTEEQQEKINEAIKIDFSGYVAHRFAGCRVVITSTMPEGRHQEMAETYTRAIEKALA